MKRAFLFTLLIMLAGKTAFNQSIKIIDSLKHELAVATQDTSRVLIMVQLCSEYRLSNPDSALFYGAQAATLATDIKFYWGQVMALGFQSMTLSSTGNLPGSLELGLKALQIGEEKNSKNATGPALDAVGGVYEILNDYPRALYYYRAMQMTSIKYDLRVGLAYAELGIGSNFSKMGQLDSALVYLEKSLADFHLISHLEPFVFTQLGDVAMKRGNNALAMDYYQRGLKISMDNNQIRGIAKANNSIALLYKKINQPDSAIYYAEKGLTIAKQISRKEVILESATLLSQLYESRNAIEALRYYKIAADTKDSLYGSGNIQAVQAIFNQDQERKKEIEEAKIAYQNQIKQYGFFIAFGVLLLIAFLLYRNNLREKKAKTQLREKNEVIEQTLTNLRSTQSQLVQSEKMASLGELTAGIAHEIQNPLNFVNNFSDVNKELVDELKDELATGNTQSAIELADSIRDNEEKINHHGKRADAIVKGMLQHSRASSGQKEPTDINALADEYLRLAYHGLKAKEKSFSATTKTEFDNSIGKIDVVPQEIGRVILNLINNAFYASSAKARATADDSFAPTVIVSTKKLGNKIEISVKDNGTGIPHENLSKIFQPFFTTKPTGQGTGLGLSLAYDIITKGHGGELTVETKEGEGTTFRIELPGHS